MPPNNRSHDSDDNVEWTYSIVVKHASELTDSQLLTVDEGAPRNFPYCGW